MCKLVVYNIYYNLYYSIYMQNENIKSIENSITVVYYSMIIMRIGLAAYYHYQMCHNS